MDEQYLSHHGILGQRWGKRNGPPYPLGAEDHSAREKKEHWRRSLSKDSPAKESEKGQKKAESGGGKSKKNGLSDNQKRAIKIGTAALATALATYGAYKLVKYGKLDGMIERGRAEIDAFLKENGQQRINTSSIPNASFKEIPKDPTALDSFVSDTAKEISKATGFRLKDKASSITEDLQAVNPLFNGDPNDPHSNNCGYASMAYCLRRMGLDVRVVDNGSTLSPSSLANDFLRGAVHNTKAYYKDLPGHKWVDTTSEQGVAKSVINLVNELSKGDHHAFGTMSYCFYDCNHKKCAHTTAWEKIGNKIWFVDPQSGGKRNLVDYCFRLGPRGMLTDLIRLTRIDNLEFDSQDLTRLTNLQNEFCNVTR